MTREDLAKRLRQLQGDSSARSFARRIGLGEGTYRALLSGSSPTLDTLLQIRSGAEVELEWLATGEGQMRRDAPGPTEEGEGPVRYSASLPTGFRLVPRLDVSAAAGAGAMVEYEEPSEMLAFRADWLRRRGINPLAAHVLTARGDSMEPTIRDGDILLVDTSIDRVVDNAIYVVAYDGRTLVKRVQMRLDGSLLLKSDNKAIFDDEAVSAGEVPRLNIAGRVMWYGRSI